MSAVVSVRIRKELKEEAERLGIDLRKVVERAIKEEIIKAKAEKFRQILDEGLRSIATTPEEWLKAVKESRRER